jgi:acyl-CoA thioester hydrolase
MRRGVRACGVRPGSEIVSVLTLTQAPGPTPYQTPRIVIAVARIRDIGWRCPLSALCSRPSFSAGGIMAHFKYYLRVRYSECDAQKVVFNARYGEYVDLAVTEFTRAAGLNATGMFGDFDYQVVKQTTEWKAPVRFDDVLEISVYTKHVGNTSFSSFAEFRIAGADAITATIETVYVNVDPKTLVKRTIPDSLREALTRGAPDKFVDHAGYLHPNR